MTTTTASASQLLGRARTLLADRKFEESERLFKELAQVPGHEAIGFYGQGVCRFELGDYKSAFDLFTRSIQLSPGQANAYYYLGRILSVARRTHAAREMFSEALKHNPKHAGARRELGLPTQGGRRGRRPGKSSRSFSEMLERESTELARQTLEAMSRVEWSSGLRASAFLGRFFALWIILGVGGFALAAGSQLLLPLVFLGVALIATIVGLLKIKTTRVVIEDGRLVIQSGIIGRSVRTIELYRVHDLEIHRSMVNRITGDGVMTLFVEGGHRGAHSVKLRGVAAGEKLQRLFDELRTLVLLLRTGNWGKGFIS